jgi:hypothetical protein
MAPGQPRLPSFVALPSVNPVNCALAPTTREMKAFTVEVVNNIGLFINTDDNTITVQ